MRARTGSGLFSKGLGANLTPFSGLAGQRANKGVFITTSGFTAQAVLFAGSVERIVLVDGARLAQLMMDHEVGVTSQSIKLPKIDSDYFDE